MDENPPLGLRCAMIHLAIGTAPDTSRLRQWTRSPYAVISMSTERDWVYGARQVSAAAVSSADDLSSSQCLVPPRTNHIIAILIITRVVTDCILHTAFCQREYGYGSRLQIWTLDTADFQNLTTKFKVKFVVKFSRRSDHFVQRHEPKCGKMPYLEEFFK